MFRNGAYCTIWGVSRDERGNVNVELSTSRKDKNTGEYSTDFSSKFVRFFGDAGDKAMSLERGDRIKIAECGVTNRYDKEKERTYTNFYVFDWEHTGDGNLKPKPNNEAFDGSDEDLPF